MLLDILPPYYVLTLVAVFGLIMGSFLDVFLSRFHTGASINGRSHCTSCGHTLSWYELIPLFSYIALRGRCKVCKGRIPIRLFLMELSFAFLYAYLFLASASFLFFLFSAVLFSLLFITAIYDVRHMVIPNEFVIALFACSCAYVLYGAYTTGSWNDLVWPLVSAVCSSCFFATLWIVSKGKWIGLGDAKLAFPLGLMLNISSAFSFVVLSFWIGAIVSIVLLLLQHLWRSGKHRLPILTLPLTMKSEVPFAPFMILAFMAVFLLHADVLTMMLHFF